MRKVNNEMNGFEENENSIEISMDVSGADEDEWGANEAALLYAQIFHKKAGYIFDPECYTKEDVCFLCGIIAFSTLAFNNDINSDAPKSEKMAYVKKTALEAAERFIND